MPRVPTYEGPEVQTAPLRPPSARPLDVSSGTRALGQGIVNLTDGLDRKAERDAEAEAYDAEFKATSAWLEWDAEARKTARGQNVDQYEKAAEEWWTKAREEYGRDLSPRAKALIGRSLQQKHLSAKANVAAFAGAERERHADEVAMADIATTIQFGVTSGTLDATRQQVNEKVARFGARKGWTTEQVQAAQAKFVSSMHIAAIDKLDAEDALSYFTANVDEIEYDKQGDLRKHLERNIEVEATRREAEAEKAKREAEERLLDSAWGLYAQNQPVPPSVLAALPGREAAQLLNAIESRAAREAKGGAIPPNDALYNQLALDINAGEKVDLRAYVERLPSEKLDKLQALQKDLATPEKQSYRVTVEQRMSPYLASLDDDSKKARFRDWVYDEMAAFAKKNNREPTEEERDKILDQGFMQGEIPGRWNDTEGYFFEVATTPELQMQFVPDEIPDLDRQQVIEAYRAMGIDSPSEAQIVQLYMKTKAP